MSHPSSDLPPQLRNAGATDLERRLLEAAAHEQPSPELTTRMAAALGLSAVAIGATAAGAALKTATTASKAAWGSSALWPWVSLGVLGLATAGVVVGMRARTATVPQPRPDPPAVILPQLPPAAPVEVPAAPSTEPQPAVGVPLPVRPHPSAVSPNDLRAQIELVDKARAAVAEGEGQRALEMVRRYQERYPTGAFRPEAAALNIEALARLGRTAEARAQAERFVAEHAGSPLADRVARIAGLVRP